ncbi:unnamed protein product [Linum tenue]|nr:unnamed protein product [Linum tenue]
MWACFSKSSIRAAVQRHGDSEFGQRGIRVPYLRLLILIVRGSRQILTCPYYTTSELSWFCETCSLTRVKMKAT